MSSTGAATLDVRLRPGGSILEDGFVGNERLVLVARQDREAWEDIEMVKVRVALDEDDSMCGWKLLC